MLRKRIAYSMIAAAGALFIGGAPVLAQEAQQPSEQQQQPSEQQQQQQEKQPEAQQKGQQLNKESQEALVRLHALAYNRARYAAAGAQRAENAQVKSFLAQRARQYKAADAKVMAFAKAHGVDLTSPEMQQKAQKTTEEWQKELSKLEGMNRAEAAQQVLTTFIDRNNMAIKDLRTIRGQAVQAGVRKEINSMIASLEQESTRAQVLQRRLQQRQQQQPKS